ncbi:hypothetical protein [Amycolatopsis sp. 195334CR]|uniref:hypothetical protein n=1 Tax=Amycolatopsis sp. 195334CR TaxID=2814588 RepID=UPI001A8FDF58|nr:hypothetical protein [Amycolatopsis sp. 195334CR]MBN6039115.1 hypothetical protein [Amycolatopsis sp. 195334CR]
MTTEQALRNIADAISDTYGDFIETNPPGALNESLTRVLAVTVGDLHRLVWVLTNTERYE